MGFICIVSGKVSGRLRTLNCEPIAEVKILVTDHLSPEVAVSAVSAGFLGVVARRGGATSHAANLLRAHSIVSVSGYPIDSLPIDAIVTLQVSQDEASVK